MLYCTYEQYQTAGGGTLDEAKITDNLPVIYNIIGSCLLEEDDIYKRLSVFSRIVRDL